MSTNLIHSRLHVAHDRLELVKQRVRDEDPGAPAEVVLEGAERNIGNLIDDTVRLFVAGKIPKEQAAEMIAMGVEGLDDDIADGDPNTNGEFLADALARVPAELLDGPLHDLIESHPAAEVRELIATIDSAARAQHGGLF